MKLPYIICHMVESIDGRIDCHMVDKISGDEYYDVLEQLNCQASVEGRITMQKYYAATGTFHATDTTPCGHEDVFKATDRRDFHICPDTHGTLLWDSAVFDDGRPLLVMTCENVPAEYLRYLTDKDISYIVAGKASIDLRRACHLLAEHFGVERLAVLGGGLINGAFLEAGILNEVSLLLAPGIDGRTGWRALFDGIADQSKLPTRLHLTHLERLPNDVVALRYTL